MNQMFQKLLEEFITKHSEDLTVSLIEDLLKMNEALCNQEIKT